jgi:hypothetical protein
LSNSLGKKDGKTKDRVEGWRKNIHALTTDLKKQVNILDELDNGDNNTEGRGDIRRDYFSMVVARLQKDIEDLVRICQKVMTLNIKKAAGNKEVNDQNWTLQRQTVRNEAMKVLQLSQDSNIDKFLLLAKMMNMRDSLQK